jgi:hypothetical protein
MIGEGTDRKWDDSLRYISLFMMAAGTGGDPSGQVFLGNAGNPVGHHVIGLFSGLNGR